MRRLLAPALAAAAAALLMGAASDPAERLADPGKESHARQLFQQFRCLVCQNESIDDSDAELAHDLRMIVRGQVAAGRSDAQIKAFMVERYGEFILLKPPLNPGNALLWATPALIVLLGGAFFAMRARRKAVLETPLSPEEERRLAALAGGGGLETSQTSVGLGNKPGMTET